MAIDSKIRNIIHSNGHIKIDDMMREVLSNNHNSYYKSIQNIGENGDFITSPEISQLFGEILALWAIEKWQELGSPKKFVLLELGPGEGKLIKDFLRTAKLVPEFFEAAQIYLLEINPHLIVKQKENTEIYKKDIKWISDMQEIPKIVSIVISNEFFDSLPIKQYKKVKNKWCELVLTIDPVDGCIKYDKIELHKILQEALSNEYVNAHDGAVIEESLESLEIIRFFSQRLYEYGGAKLIIDYGYNINAKDRNRHHYNATLQAIKDHQYHPILSSLGKADLTSHVDFNALKSAAYEQGINNYTVSSQRKFLMKYGIELRLKSLQSSLREAERKIVEKQFLRLTSKDQMGNLFKVLELFYLK